MGNLQQKNANFPFLFPIATFPAQWIIILIIILIYKQKNGYLNWLFKFVKTKK